MGVMGDSPVIERAAGREKERHRRGQWLLLAGFLVLAAVVVGLAYWAWEQQAESITGQAKRSLDAVAELKAGQIAAWSAERHGDAEVLRDDELLSAAVSDLLAGRDAAASAARVRSYLHEIQQSYGYVDVVLVAPDGRTLMRAPATARHPLGPRVYALIAEAERTREVVSSDLYLGPGGVARIELVAPILASRPPTLRSPASCCTSILSGSSIPSSRTGHCPSDSGETLLVERRGDRVVYLNELRHRKGTALELADPCEQAEAAGRHGRARPARGSSRAVDYRGVPVMAAIAPVPATDWYVVAKVDESEVLDPIRRRGWLTAGFTLLVVALGATGALLLWRLRERQVDEALVASELQVPHALRDDGRGCRPPRAGPRRPLRRADRLPDPRTSIPRSSEQTGLHTEARRRAGGYRRSTRRRMHRTWTSTPGRVGEHAPQRFESYFEPLERHCRGCRVRPAGRRPFRDDLPGRHRAGPERGRTEAPASAKFREHRGVARGGLLQRHARRRAAGSQPGLLPRSGHERRHRPAGPAHAGLLVERRKTGTAYVRLLQKEGRVRDYLAAAKRVDGSRLVVLLNAHVVRDDTGEIERIEGTVLDFTARKAAEDEVERLNAELEQRVADRHRGARRRQQGARGVRLLRVPRPARAAAAHQRLLRSAGRPVRRPTGRTGSSLRGRHLDLGAADGSAHRRPAPVLAHRARGAARSSRSTCS